VLTRGLREITRGLREAHTPVTREKLHPQPLNFAQPFSIAVQMPVHLSLGNRPLAIRGLGEIDTWFGGNRHVVWGAISRGLREVIAQKHLQS
jgi:hypothetical protein